MGGVFVFGRHQRRGLALGERRLMVVVVESAAARQMGRLVSFPGSRHVMGMAGMEEDTAAAREGRHQQRHR